MYGRRGHEHYAMSSVDLALWDLKAKLAGMPLHRLLGAARERVPFYIAGGYYAEGKTLDDLQHEVAGYVAQGARAVKIKIGGAPMHDDLARIRAVREAVGDASLVMVDANCAYSADEALRIGARMSEFDVAWFEEPVAPGDLPGYARLAQHLPVPIAAGEQEYGLDGFRDLILS
jgi:L-alanine-DL-glutamate epimerase-like enolase superfamily enzyme